MRFAGIIIIFAVAFCASVQSQTLTKNEKLLKTMIDRKAEKSDTSKYVMPWEIASVGRVNAANSWTQNQTMASLSVPSLNGVSLPSVHKIYFMGNSLTAAGTYPNKVGSLLGDSWAIVNKGIPGNTTTQMRARFATDVTSNEDCEYVVIMGGVNDIFHDYEGFNPDSTKHNLQAMYTAAHNAGIKVVALNISPIDYVGIPASRQAYLAEVNVWIRDSSENVDYRVDTHSLLEDPSNHGTLLPAYSADGLHLTASGYNVLGTAVYNAVTWRAFLVSRAYRETSPYYSEVTTDVMNARVLNMTGSEVSTFGGPISATALRISGVSILDRENSWSGTNTFTGLTIISNTNGLQMAGSYSMIQSTGSDNDLSISAKAGTSGRVIINYGGGTGGVSFRTGTTETTQIVNGNISTSGTFQSSGTTYVRGTDGKLYAFNGSAWVEQ